MKILLGLLPLSMLMGSIVLGQKILGCIFEKQNKTEICSHKSSKSNGIAENEHGLPA